MTQLLVRFWFVISVILLVTIACLSLLPQEELPTVSGTDKLHHYLAYAALAFPAAFARPRHWYLMIVFYLAFSGLIEIVQPYVNRTGDWFDLLANACGLLSGVVVAFIARFIFSRYETESREKVV